jgi:4-hydroxybenzoate polyprenyltransferase
MKNLHDLLLPLNNSHPRVHAFIQLTRLDRPVGIWLLLWPTWWSLWLAARGMPSWGNLVIFTLGCILMRSAGCAINDYADRHLDGQVSRTRLRPLATGRLTARDALMAFGILCFLAFLLVLLTNKLTIMLACAAASLTVLYPFCKRHTYLPQVVLGAAFACSIPMAWAAELGQLKPEVWLLFCTALMWTIAYDTFYGMVDRADDLRVGIRSTAILFGEADRAITGILQALVLLGLLLVGHKFQMGWPFNLGLTAAAGLFVWQQYLIRSREPDLCLRAFLNNQWVGMAVFAGIALDFSLLPPQ